MIVEIEEKIVEGIHQKGNEKKIEKIMKEMETKTSDSEKVEAEKLRKRLLEFKNSTNIYQKAAYQKNKERIEQLLKRVRSVQVQNKKNNNFPTLWVIGGGILAIIGLMTLFVIKRKKRRKISLN